MRCHTTPRLYLTAVRLSFKLSRSPVCYRLKAVAQGLELRLALLLPATDEPVSPGLSFRLMAVLFSASLLRIRLLLHFDWRNFARTRTVTTSNNQGRTLKLKVTILLLQGDQLIVMLMRVINLLLPLSFLFFYFSCNFAFVFPSFFFRFSLPRPVERVG